MKKKSTAASFKDSRTLAASNAARKAEATTAAVAEQGAPVAPKQATPTKATTQKKGAPKSQKAAKAAKAPAPAKEASAPRELSKKDIVLDLLRRPTGATMAEITAATDWQNHSVRGFISGHLGKKMGLQVESTKNEAGERTYRIAD